MYEKPNLICVGPAQEVILGYYLHGSDIDGSYMSGYDEFVNDADEFENAAA